MVKRVLMIAYHYPPVRGSSGVQRTLQFSRYLPESGWEPVVLTVNPRAYSQTGDDQLSAISPGLAVKRAFALDARRHLSVMGKFPGMLALPDRWSSWWLGAVPAGLRLIRKYRPQIIWSTYPIATAHLIALTLHRLSGIPWIADFRDSMTEELYPERPSVWRAYRWIESRTVASAARCVFTAPGAVRMYADRYPRRSSTDWVQIPNGYDETSFARIHPTAPQQSSTAHPVTLVHSGVLYPSERDPTHFFNALARLKHDRVISPASFRVILRASGHDHLYQQQLRDRNIDNIVLLEQPLSYGEALSEMMSADGLLLFQATNCNHQIPAKAYEYMRAQRPVLALTDPTGDTADLLRGVGIQSICDLTSEVQIYDGISTFLDELKSGSAFVPSMDNVKKYSRKEETRELAEILDEVDTGNHD